MSRAIRLLAIMLGLLCTGAAETMHAADNIVDALKGGKVYLFLRYRFEYVDDD